MKEFFIKIEVGKSKKYYITYWFYTDLRDDEETDIIDVEKIAAWVKR